MTLVLPADLGIELAATASAFPVDLGVGAGDLGAGAGDLDNAGAYRALLGAGYAEELRARGWSVEHPERAWGVCARQWLRPPGVAARPGEPGVADLAALAARRCLEEAGVSGADVVVAATSTPASITSSLAGAVGRALGGDAPCLDVRAGGAAALYAWLVAARLLVADGASALVVAAEATSAWLDPRDSAHALLYGDGAGAVLLRRVPGDAGLLGAVARNAAVGGRPFTVPGPLPPTAEALAAGAYRVQAPDAAYAAGLLGERERVLRELRAAHPAACASARALVSNAVTRAQAEHEAAAFGVEPAAVHTTLARHGALGCAAPLVALDELRGAAPAAETFALTAVGGGVAAAALVWRSTAGRETPAR